jgi:hypothetical protein
MRFDETGGDFEISLDEKPVDFHGRPTRSG